MDWSFKISNGKIYLVTYPWKRVFKTINLKRWLLKEMHENKIYIEKFENKSTVNAGKNWKQFFFSYFGVAIKKKAKQM